MSRLFFPDNTVLVNFTHIDRHEILEWFLRGHGAWTISTARECSNSARVEGLGQMARWHDVLPPPLAPANAELIDAKTIALQMRKPGDIDPAKNMGEAETIAVIARRGIEAVFLTDDHDAARRAQEEPLIEVASTTKVLAFAEVMDRLSHADARACLAELSEKRRVLGNPPRVGDYDDYVEDLRDKR